MRVNSFMRVALCAAAVSGLSALAAAPASAGCKSLQTATATGSFKGITGVEARAAWRLAVIKDHGVAYALWSKAKFSSTRCWTPDKGGPKYKCVARAKPCA